MSDNLNITHADCLRTVSDFGSSTIHNICTGATSTVPWGTADWALAVFVCGFGFGMLLMLLGITFSVVRDW